MAYRVERLGQGRSSLMRSVGHDVFDGPVDADRLTAYLQSPGHLMVVALDGAQVVGQCAGVVHRHPDKPTELYIDEVGTASTHRRQGIARAMLDELVAWGRDQGCEEAWVGTEPDNAAARGLYESVGARIRSDPVEPFVMYVFYLS